MNLVGLRLKIKHFFKKNGKIILIALILFTIVYLINYIIDNIEKKPVATTTLTTHTSVIDSNYKTPQKEATQIEKMINDYVEACNEGNYVKAYEMLSDDCKKYSFNNEVTKFMEHVYLKMPLPRVHAIQNYSNVKYSGKRMYIYEVKYFEDMLATGLTNSDYAFTSEKMTFYTEDGKLVMNIGDYLYHEDIKNISENEHLKIDILDRAVKYSIEQYTIKLTNRSEYTVVIADNVEVDEIMLTLPHEGRKRSEVTPIVLGPKETKEVVFTFPKFADDGDTPKSIVFSSIRVMEKYSGTEDVSDEVIQSEIDNAVNKYKMEVSIH